MFAFARPNEVWKRNPYRQRTTATFYAVCWPIRIVDRGIARAHARELVSFTRPLAACVCMRKRVEIYSFFCSPRFLLMFIMFFSLLVRISYVENKNKKIWTKHRQLCFFGGSLDLSALSVCSAIYFYTQHRSKKKVREKKSTDLWTSKKEKKVGSHALVYARAHQPDSVQLFGSLHFFSFGWLCLCESRFMDKAAMDFVFIDSLRLHKYWHG